MNKLLTPEQLEIQEMVRDFTQNEVTPISAEYDKKGELPMEVYQKAFDMGLHLADYPTEYGGSGLDALTYSLVVEELSRGDAGFAIGVSATSLAYKPVLIAGNDEQKKAVGDLLLPGGFGAFCLTEANAGSDVSALKTTATKDGDEYIINGTKSFITNGGVSNIYIVFALTDKDKGARGMSAFLVERTREGISFGKEEDKFGIRLSNTSEVIFSNVRIPKENLLGEEGDGFKIAMKTLDLSRPIVASSAVGICQAAIDYSTKYAKERVTFGRSIAKFQAIQFKLADMEIKTDTARQYARYCCQLLDKGIMSSKDAAIAKCYAGDIAMEVTNEAIQIFGGYGYSREYPIEKLMRDAKIYQIFEGTNEIQRVVISGNMLA